MDMGQLREQLEFYFSDSNYARDRFMKEVAAKNNNLIPIDTILTFKRIKKLGATKQEIKQAIVDSEIVGLEGESLKKIENESYKAYCKDKELDKKIVCMKGFNKQASLDEIKEILKEYCKPVRISMRKNKEKEFIGDCVVEFKSAEDADEILKTKIEGEMEEGAKRRCLGENREIITIRMREYEEEIKKQREEATNKKFIEKVKRDFIGKLYKYETESKMDIADIKKIVKGAAFVDLDGAVIRMKYREDWDENEFKEEEKKIKLLRMTDEEAKEYADGLEIKKVPKKKK